MGKSCWVYVGIDKKAENKNEYENVKEEIITNNISEKEAYKLSNLLEKTANKFMKNNNLW